MKKMEIEKVVENVESSLKKGSHFVDLIEIRRNSFEDNLFEVKKILESKNYKCSYTKESPSYSLRSNQDYFKLRVENPSNN